MIRKMSTLRTFFSFSAILVLSIASFGDTIRLKDGSLIKGTIVSFADGRFIVAVGEGTRRRELTLSSDEIASIEFDPRTASNDTSLRTNQPASESRILPVSTKPAPTVVVTDTNRTSTPPENQRLPADTTNSSPNRTAASPASRPQVMNPAANSTSTAAPVALNVRVLADNTANGWTNTGFVVKKGQRISISGSGKVSLGKGQSSTPGGLPDLEDTEKLLKGVPTGALLAVIGDDNNDFIYIGNEREFTAGRDGTLYLGLNEGNLNDNSGSYDVKLEIILVPGS